MRQKQRKVWIVGLAVVIVFLMLMPGTLAQPANENSNNSTGLVVLKDTDANLHKVWQEEVDGNLEIFYLDGGNSPSNGLHSKNSNVRRITFSETDSVHPAMAFDDVTGDLYIVWTEVGEGLYCAHTSDGRWVPNMQLSETPDDPFTTYTIEVSDSAISVIGDDFVVDILAIVPQGLEVLDPKTGNQLDLSWIHEPVSVIPGVPPVFEIYYLIYRSADGVNYANIGTSHDGTYSDRSVIDGTPYWYKIRMVRNGLLSPDLDAISPFSETVSGVSSDWFPQNPPTNFHAVKLSEDPGVRMWVRFSWTDADNEIGHDNQYKIYMGLSPSLSFNLIHISTTTTADVELSSPPEYSSASAYFVVTAFEPSRPHSESTGSNYCYKVKEEFTYNDMTTNNNWISLPYRSEYQKASDIVKDIENVETLGPETNQKIAAIGKWDPSIQGVTESFSYSTTGPLSNHGWKAGVDFDILPGDGITVQPSGVGTTSFIWSFVGSDVATTLSFSHNEYLNNNNWISLPGTFMDVSGDGDFTASDVVLDIEGGLGPDMDTKITAIGKWDPTIQDIGDVFYYIPDGGPVFPGWRGGTDFAIAPGEGITIQTSGNTPSFDWTPTIYGAIMIDNDKDGMNDPWERSFGLAPNDPTDALEDGDLDLLTNLEEFQYLTDPTDPDTDDDDLSDEFEVRFGLDIGGLYDPHVVNERYAILISGCDMYIKYSDTGEDLSAHAFWEDLVDNYRMVHDYYGLDDDNVFVAYGDGLNEHIPHIPIEYEIDIVEYPATRNHIDTIFQEVGDKATSHDLVYTYIISHGMDVGPDYATHCFMVPPKLSDLGYVNEPPALHEAIHDGLTYEYLYDFNFAGEPEAISGNIYTGHLSPRVLNIFSLQPCYSGGFIDSLSAPNRIIMTDSQRDIPGGWYLTDVNDHTSWSAEHGEFSIQLNAALTGAYTVPGYPYFGDADYNNDGQVSMAETFNYVWYNDNTRRVGIGTDSGHVDRYIYPHYDDNGDGIAHQRAMDQYEGVYYGVFTLHIYKKINSASFHLFDSVDWTCQESRDMAFKTYREANQVIEIDQLQIQTDTNLGNLDNNNGFGQTFIPGGETIPKIDIYLGVTGVPNDGIRLHLLEGGLDGMEIASAYVTDISNNGWNTFEFVNPPLIESGNIYSFYLETSTSLGSYSVYGGETPSYGPYCEVLTVYDAETKYEDLPVNGDGYLGEKVFLGDFRASRHTYDSVMQTLSNYAAIQPTGGQDYLPSDIIKTEVLGTVHYPLTDDAWIFDDTIEPARDFDIFAVKISDKVQIDETDEPEIYIGAGIHGDEIDTVEAAMNMIRHLIRGYVNNDPEVVEIVDNHEIWIVPMINPRGFTARKRGNQHFDKIPDSVDLNRNFPLGWSPLLPGECTPGETPFSETETQAIKYLLDYHAQDLSMAISLHTEDAAVYYPWAYIDDVPEDEAEYQRIGSELANLIGWPGECYQFAEFFSGTGGLESDWIYDYTNKDALAFTVEFKLGVPCLRSELPSVMASSMDALTYAIQES